jgi:hypothetical protein
MDTKSRNWVVGAFILAFALGYMYSNSGKPKRPILTAIKNTIAKVLWIAPLVPFFLDDGPPEVEHQELYSTLPPREVGDDGYEQLDFSKGW